MLFLKYQMPSYSFPIIHKDLYKEARRKYHPRKKKDVCNSTQNKKMHVTKNRTIKAD